MSAILTCRVLVMSMSLAAAEAPPDCPLVPVPKVYRDTGRWLRMAKDGETAIVLGAKATEPEHYTAERLQTLIERRFKRRLALKTSFARDRYCFGG
jgi:hypothetical protein